MKPYDLEWFDKLNTEYEIDYYSEKLTYLTTRLAKGYDGVIAFVNDTLNSKTINQLYEFGVKVIALRCSGYNNVNMKAAHDKITIMRVPVYSPYAVAEHSMALFLSLNRKIHKAYNRTRDFNFSLNGLTGFDLNGKTVGVIGTGKIGQIFIKICKGFGMNVIAYDPNKIDNPDFTYVDLDTLYKESDVISLHCQLIKSTEYMLNAEAFSMMKDGVYIINTSRGGLIESEALLNALKTQKVAGAGLDVYEEETELFFEDFSSEIIDDDILARLVSLPNVIITSHQAFLTDEALKNIAEITLKNLDDFFNGINSENEIHYNEK